MAAAVTGLLSGLTHSTVLPFCILLLVLVVSDLVKSKKKGRWFTLLIPVMPLLGVILFLAWRTDQGFPSIPALLGSSWGSQMFNPIPALGQLAASIVLGNPLSILKFILILLGIGGTVWLFRQKKWDLAIYQAGLLLYLVSFTVPDHPLGSFIRYFLLSFPVFMALGFWLQSRRWWSALAFFSLAAVNLILCSMYLSWVFVA